MNTREQRILDGAQAYAASDRSDPFALRRALTHIRTGVVGYNSHNEDAIYSAEPYQEQRMLPDGRTYHVTVYRNIKRP